MAALGLYQKFDSDASPVLNHFAKHLECTLLVTQKDYRNQIVANVNRVLFKLHPNSENPDALADTEVKEYFNCMQQDLSSNSKNNYIKASGMNVMMYHYVFLGK
ncbi:hypothetical protein ACJMK2_004807 [Sinanodonta woodiana]|uniref:Uncharacterized protein n=1 Tax=Sinanodonta woodiana TaxID=1069815 RepID=A0ABD3VNS1_SINWO